MTPTSADIEAHVITLLQEIARDWDYAGDIGPGTRLFADLGFESLDAVILGTAIQERYQRPMPFAQLLADIGQRSTPELTVGELVSFVQLHVSQRMVRA
ncbi:MAG TPA: acyl carrier protein [Vicinamibacterales bacterium]